MPTFAAGAGHVRRLSPAALANCTAAGSLCAYRRSSAAAPSRGADMQGPVGGGQDTDRCLLAHVDLAGGLHHVGHQLHPHPAAAVARHLDAAQAEVDDVLDVGRVQHRDACRDQREIRLVRGGGGLRAMVIARQHQYAAGGAGAGEVAVLERVAAAVHTRSLAVPDAEHAVHRCPGKGADILCAPDRGGGQVLIHARLEADVGRPQQRRDPPQLHIEPAQRRAAISGDKAAGIPAQAAIDAALVQRDPHDGLVPREKDLAGQLLEAVIQPWRLQRRWLRRCVHA